jgi:NADH-quinone oxidoreductase subunit N
MFEFDINSLFFIMPELVLTLGLVLVLLVDLFLTDKFKAISYYLTQVVIISTLVANLSLFGTNEIIFTNSFVVDNFALSAKAFILSFMVLLLIYVKEYLRLSQNYRTEFLLLLLTSTLGMMIMTSGASTLILYLGLEILSLSLYGLIAMATKNSKAIEAGLKYFVLGAIASGILLYGISLLYGASGSLLISDIATLNFDEQKMLISFALVFIVIGIAFKLGAVPFHMWVPDVYQGAPLGTTMFLSSVPKIAALALIYRILVQGLESSSYYWSDFFLFLGLISIIIGTLVALVQTNIKRLLAYSTIANIGFILISFALSSKDGYIAGTFYTVIYAITAITTFGLLITWTTNKYEINKISDLAGLGKYSAGFAFILLIVIFSMAGIPPFIGFWSKLVVVKEVVAAGYLEIAVIMVIFAVIAAYYYLQIIRTMYFDKAVNKLDNKTGIGFKITLFINILIIALLSLKPNYLLDIIIKIF